MFFRFCWFGVLGLATCNLMFAQTKTNPPEEGTREITHPGERYTSASVPNPCQSTLHETEILTDTMGVDFGPYLTEIVPVVRRNWYRVMPQSAYPPNSKKGKLAIEFVVSKDGKVSGITLHPANGGLMVNTASGDVALDGAASESIIASNPFPPLPKEFPGETLGLRFYYFYNSQPISMTISPCVDVRVPVGSTLKFVIGGTDSDTSVMWSVSGPGRAKSACGTISNSGIFTAPTDIPNPPILTVEAKAQSDFGATARVKVVIVQPNSSP